MANDKYTLDVAINAADAANSLKEVKQSLRDLKNIQLEFGEGTEEYRKASQKIGELKDKMNDANDTARVLSGNMTENLTGSFARVATAGIGAFQAVEGAQAVFGVENEDLQKQMVKLQGLLNLSQGIKEFANIGQAAKDFRTVLGVLIPATVAQTTATEGAAVAQTSLNAAMAANPIGAVVAALALLVGAIVLFTNSTDESKKQLDELSKSEKKFNESIKETNTTIDRRLKTLRDNLELSKLDGKDRELRAADIQKENALLDLQIQKQKEYGSVLAQLRLLNLQYIQSKDDPAVVKDIVRQIDALKKEGTAILVKEKQNEKLIVEQAEQDKLNIEKKYQAQSVKQVKDSQSDKNKIYQESAKQIAAQIDADSAYELESQTRAQMAREALMNDFNLSEEELRAVNLQMREEEGYQMDYQIYEEYQRRLTRQKEYAATAAQIDADSAAEMEAWALGEAQKSEERSQKELEDAQALQQAKINAVQNGLSTIANLAQLFAGKSEKAQKRAFDIQKGVNIAGAVVDTYRSAVAAYASQLIPSDPTSIVRAKIAAAAAVAAGLLNIKRIKDQKFNSPAMGGGAGGENLSSAPTTLQTQTTVTTGQFAGFGEFKPGELTDRRVYVVESDITGVQRKVQVIEDRSKF